MMIKKQRGFTLLELMVVVAVLGVLTALAAPFYQNLMERQKIRSALNEWQNSFYFARSEAMRRKETIVLCGSTDGLNCSNTPVDFSDGWIVKGTKTASPVLQDNNTVVDANLSIVANSTNLRTTGIRFASNGRILNHTMGFSVVVKKTGTADTDSRAKQLRISSAGRVAGVAR